MKRELGFGRCGLACCLCSQNTHCGGCDAGDCTGISWCENRACSLEKNVAGCGDCDTECRKGLLARLKPYTFMLFIRRYGREALLDCLERNEKNGIVYHKTGNMGDYDDFTDSETLISFIQTGKRDA
jgi:hypothetical protein